MGRRRDLPEMRQIGVHRRIDESRRQGLAQDLLHLFGMQQETRFVDSDRKRRRSLLQTLLRKEFRAQRVWLRNRRRNSPNEVLNIYILAFIPLRTLIIQYKNSSYLIYIIMVQRISNLHL